MLTPREISEKTFDKTFGFGYRMDDVDAYLKQVAESMTELIGINADIEKKMEVLAAKLNEYREDEESLRTAILGAQKLGDSVIRESKTKAEIITRDATCKAEAMVNSAKRQIEREHENLIRTQHEVATFKNRLLDMYRQHIELISMMPGEEEEPEEEIPQPDKPQEEPAPEPEPERETAFEAEQPEPEPESEPEDEPAAEEGAQQDITLESPERYFGIDLDDLDDYEDEDDIDDSVSRPETSKHGEMRFGDAFRIKHKGTQHKFRK